jgi:hypothetical protein
MHAVVLATAISATAAAQCPITFATDVAHTPAVPESQRTVTADFDGDGRADLATLGRRGPFVVSILWGRGDGTFEPPVNLRNAAGFGLAVGDLNEDGRPELVFTPDSGSFAVDVVSFGTDRTPTFQLPPVVRNGFVVEIALTDLDADGHLDAAFITANGSIGVRLARGDGAGSFTGGRFGASSPPAGQNTQTITAAAVRSPRQPDLFITTSGGGASRIHTCRFQGWDNAPAFTDTRDLDRTHTHLAASDLDRDGHDDLVLDTFSTGSGGISVFFGAPDGSLAPERLTQSGAAQPLNMTTADLDGDGRAEVLTTNPTFTVFRNSGPDGFLPTLYNFANLGTRTISVADFDRDGRADVALTTGSVTVTADIVVNTGPLPFIRPILDPLYTCPGQPTEARVSITRFANPVSWQSLTPSGWIDLTEGSTVTTPSGETFGAASNTDQPVLRVAVSQGCCFTSHAAVVRCLASTVCGTTLGPPIRLIVCRADFTCDGFLDFFDYDDFVASFEGGC